MANNLTIEVTDEDIKNGVQCETEKCPVALATIRALRTAGIKFQTVHVERSFVRIWFVPLTETSLKSWWLPVPTEQFVRNFDEGYTDGVFDTRPKLAPFIFMIDLDKPAFVSGNYGELGEMPWREDEDKADGGPTTARRTL